MHNARLDGGLRPGRFDRFGESGQPVATHDQDVVDAEVGPAAGVRTTRCHTHSTQLQTNYRCNTLGNETTGHVEINSTSRQPFQEPAW